MCAHVERVRIELLLAGGAGQIAVARKHGVSKDSIHRHWANHVSAERRASLVMGPVQRQALAAQVAEEASSVLDHHRAVRAGLYQRYSAALDAADNQSVALLAGRLTDVNNAISRLTGELAHSPLVQNNTAIFMNSPLIEELQRMLKARLAPFPAALGAVIEGLEELSAHALAGASQPQRAALEHGS